MAVEIVGLGLVQTAIVESVPQVVADYNQNWQTIQNVLNKDPSTITAADAASVGNAMAALHNLAQNGLSVTSNDIHGNPVTSTQRITADMASQINLLGLSMQAAGIQDVTNPTATQILQWQDLGVQGVNMTVARAGQAITDNRSIQAMIELEYVKTGNDVLSQQLSKLQTALSTTQAVTQTLTTLQNLRNILAPENRSGFHMSSIAGLSLNAATSAYNQIASSLFGQPLNVYINFSGANPPTTPQNVINQLYQIRQALTTELATLDQITPPQISASGMAIRSANSLGGQVATVLRDMAKFFDPTNTGTQTISISGMEAYLIDNLNSHLGTSANPSAANAAGKVQQDLDQAIQASTNLNDTQKEQFQRYMFVFQEFYKSAASMLTSINQLIATMAQNAGNG